MLFLSVPEAAFLWAGVACYGGSAILILWQSKTSGTSQKLPYYLLGTGIILLAIALATRWVTLGQGPFITMYEVLLSNTFSLGLVNIIIFSYVPQARNGAVLIVPFLFLLGIWTLNSSTEPVPLPPTFDNYMLWLHVLAGKLFLGTCLATVGLSGVLCIRHIKSCLLQINNNGNFTELDSVIWRLFSIAFIFDSLMIVAGSIWAHDAWGRYWGWDPLETWSLVTWLAMGTSLHVRLTFQLPLWSGWLMVIGVFVLAFLTFFGVPFLNTAPHSGIM